MISKLKIRRFSSLLSMLIILLLLSNISTSDNVKSSSKQSPVNELDICGGNGFIDSHSLNIGSTPWNIANASDYIDISLCSTFNQSANYRSYFIPDECKDSHICHHKFVGFNSKIRIIGYKLTHVVPELNTTRAVYVGPKCNDQRNYTIYLRFTCGNHLGHPSFPIASMKADCLTILDWETSAACNQQRPTNSFGVNEMRCYVLDNKQRIRDLTPLIRPNGYYRVMADSKEFYINVCTNIGGINNRCSTIDGTSACLLTTGSKVGFIQSVGTYKWPEIKFIESSGQNEREFIELTYNQAATTSCNPRTKIRFICPKYLPKSASYHNYPILISDLDCEYIIEWITDYACPVDTIGQSIDMNTCQIEKINLKSLPRTSFIYSNLLIDGRNKSIYMNICGSVDQRCPSTSSVCLIDDQKSQSIGSISETKFFKADNHLSIVFKSKNAGCKNRHGNSMNSRTIIDLECDDSLSLQSTKNQPDFIGFEDETCVYKFHWKTSTVCPLFEKENLNCSLITNDSQNNIIQIDLSSLRLSDSYYISEKSAMKFLFNVCDRIPSTLTSTANKNVPNICQQSAACLIDLNQNLSFSIGHFTRPIVYNEQFRTFELLYTNGFDLIRNKTVNTRLIFICSKYQSEPSVINFDNINSEYVIEFRTPAACPMNAIVGNECKVYDPMTENTFDLSPLKSLSYYVIRTDQYEYELNVCSPIIGGTCSQQSDVAICQKELNGDKRKYSLGTYHSNLVYWNSILNMTFTNGDRYNDEKRTPRKSHISFICDETAGKGHPEFVGESNRSYAFVWYTSLACMGDLPKTSHCTFENATHFIDFTPLSLDAGNHFVLNNDDSSIININFCKSLNHGRNLLTKLCKPNSAACMLHIKDKKTLNLGEPSEPPFLGYDGNVHIMLNNGDPCPYDPKVNLTSSFKMICERDSGQFAQIIQIDSDDRHKCTYEFMVRSPIACAQKLNEIQLDDCIYTDPRTNLSADLNPLRKNIDYEIFPKKSMNRNSMKFSFNFCRPVSGSSDIAVRFTDVDQKTYSYGRFDKVRVYMEQNLHIRFTDGDDCENSMVTVRKRSTDIEFVCSKVNSNPIITYYDKCLAKIYWETSAVCSLKVPSCSLFDDSGNYYSLRQLSSLSHSWRVKKNSNEYYLLNVCKPLPTSEYKQPTQFHHMNHCEKQSAVCQCNDNVDGGCVKSIGKVSDHELSIDSATKNLLLKYEEDVLNCQASDRTLIATQTLIEFRCAPQTTGMDGPTFLNETNCVHYFEWNTSFACPHNLLQNDEYRSTLSNDMVLIDTITGLHWDLGEMLKRKIITSETRTSYGHVERYDYQIQLYRDPNQAENDGKNSCSKAAICQTNGKGLYRDIGSLNNWQFVTDSNIALHLIIHSNTSRCGRNQMKNATSKIFFECVENQVNNGVQFLYESDDCEYYFLWRTSIVCPLLDEHMKSSRSYHDDNGSNQLHHRSLWFPFVLLLVIVCSLIFVGHRYYHELNFRNYFSRQLERLRGSRSSSPTTTSDVNFRYQQLNL